MFMFMFMLLLGAIVDGSPLRRPPRGAARAFCPSGHDLGPLLAGYATNVALRGCCFPFCEPASLLLGVLRILAPKSNMNMEISPCGLFFLSLSSERDSSQGI